MTQFEYTHTKRVNSSAVDGVVYNVNTKKLAVNLHGEVYVYNNVPLSRYEALVTAPSVGRFFREIKSDYGPSEYLGRNTSVTYQTGSVEAPSMAALGTPKALTLAEGVTVNNSFITLSTPTQTRTTLGLPDVVESTPVGTTRRHSVLFNVEGLTADREYGVDATSVDEAVAALTEAVAALGLDVKVKEVTVYFE